MNTWFHSEQFQQITYHSALWSHLWQVNRQLQILNLNKNNILHLPQMSTLACKYAIGTNRKKSLGKNVQFIHWRKRFAGKFIACFFVRFFFVLFLIHSVILCIIQTTHSYIMDLIMGFCATASGLWMKISLSFQVGRP